MAIAGATAAFLLRLIETRELAKAAPRQNQCDAEHFRGYVQLLHLTQCRLDT